MVSSPAFPARGAWLLCKLRKEAVISGKVLSLMHVLQIHANAPHQNKQRRPSTNCRCEEAETKATVALMASLVINRPFDVGTQQPLLSPSSSLPLWSPPRSTAFFSNAVFRECPSPHGPRHTSDIWLACTYVALFTSSHSPPKTVTMPSADVRLLRICFVLKSAEINKTWSPVKT